MGVGDTIALSTLIFLAACLYASVGHAGASGYLAAMALFGLAPSIMKPTALSLNILVAAIASIRFYRAGCFSWELFWPFAAASIPFAWLGGSLILPNPLYKKIVGVVLLFAAYRLYRFTREMTVPEIRSVAKSVALPVGAGLGFLSGLTGVGGGIFLSPLLLLMRWADVRTTAGVSVVFILVNSIAGLAGHWTSIRFIPREIVFWAPAAVVGGLLGAGLGSRRFSEQTLRRVLAAVLVIAALKLTLF